MEKLTLDHVARLPRPGMTIPGSLAFSRDAKLLTYLHAREGELARVLWVEDVDTGDKRVLFAPGEGVTEQNVSREEALRRERMRLMHTGVTSYEWARDADVILVPVLGDVWIISPSGDARHVGSDAVDPHLSADGSRVGFVRDGEVWVLDIETGEERRLTHDAQPGVTNGLAEFAAQEELNRYRGWWWNTRGDMIAFEQADERHIPGFAIPHWGRDTVDVEEHRYPFAGAENARVRLGVVPVAGGDVRWLDLGDAEYIARVDWHPDGRLFVQLLSRDQQRLELRAYDVADGSFDTLITDTSDVWVNLHDDLHFIEATGEFIWSSERSGLRQLSLHRVDGSHVRDITAHPWPVDALVAVDEKGRRVAYTMAASPVEQHLAIAALDEDAVEVLRGDRGFTSAAFSRDLSVRAEVHHSVASAPSIRLVAPSSTRSIHEAPPIKIELPLPELFTFAARDGEILHGMVFKPERLPAPLIVSVYGGPEAQLVLDSWTSRVALLNQYLAQQGFVVVSVDNRGSARRGLMFEAPLRGRLGAIEVDDQVDGVEHARSQGWVARDGVGITGWSYGGYMTIMAMLREPSIFKVGVAGAPVTDWAGYDTAYTERYLGLPKENEDGYRASSVLPYADRLEGDLLIVHGMIDENVHFRHTARFLDALAKANRSADLMIYPEERHSPRSEADRRNLNERIVEYFRERLGGSASGT